VVRCPTRSCNVGLTGARDSDDYKDFALAFARVANVGWDKNRDRFPLSVRARAPSAVTLKRKLTSISLRTVEEGAVWRAAAWRDVGDQLGDSVVAEDVVFLEHDCALFRGFAAPWPTHVWDFRLIDWKPYTGPTPKGPEWGTRISAEELERLKIEFAACRAGDDAWEVTFETIHGSDGEYQDCPAADAAYSAAHDAVLATHVKAGV
jgi:hypothetical protein